MTATAIRKLLSEAAFNPKTPGPLSAILESKDPTYLPQRAIELIREAQISTRRDDKCRSMKLAIQLLVMTQAILKAESETERAKCQVLFYDASRNSHTCDRVSRHKGQHSCGKGKTKIQEARNTIIPTPDNTLERQGGRNG